MHVSQVNRKLKTSALSDEYTLACTGVWSLLSVLSCGRCSVYCRVVAAQCTGVWLLLSVVTAQWSRSFPIFCVGDVTPVVWLFQSNGHKTHRLVRPFQGTSALKALAKVVLGSKLLNYLRKYVYM